MEPKNRSQKQPSETGLPFTYRVQPYRFQSDAVLSAQVEDIPSRKQKNMPQTKQLHYIVKTDTGQHYELAFDQHEADWLLVRTVDYAWIGSR